MDKYENNLLLFYQATNIPLCVFNNSQQDLYRYPIITSMNCSPQTLKYCSQIIRERSTTPHLPIFISSGTCFFSLLQLDSNTNVMFGPISSVPLTYKEFYNTNREFSSSDDLIHLYRVIQQSPHIKPIQFAASLSLYLKLAFNVNYSAHDIFNNHIELRQIITTHNKDTIQKTECIVVKDALVLENKILFYIQNGNMNELCKIFEHDTAFSLRKLFPSTIEELKKDFIIYAALCFKAAIDAGLDSQKAFTIFDLYISKIPSLTTVEHFASICAQLSMDYCQKIIDRRQNHANSYVVTQCIQYIDNHIDSRITVDDLAKHCNLSKRTITRHFSEYYHTPIAEYILQQKLKEAAFLLTNSNISLIEISNQLAFSSQSHFTISFKRKYKFTPKQYREIFSL